MLKDVNGNIPLHWAANNGHHEVVAVLCKWLSIASTTIVEHHFTWHVLKATQKAFVSSFMLEQIPIFPILNRSALFIKLRRADLSMPCR